ncbi:ferrous iron transport protein B, partial [bacterium]|nr:ferrous iron transport protein B [bacterium]
MITEKNCHSSGCNSAHADGLRKIAIVGTPNAGKSLIFNKLTSSYSIVANYHKTTIAVERNRASIDGNATEVIDTPGISSLHIFSEEERVTRDILLQENPEIVLFCGDATRLKSSLVLLNQIHELGIPAVFCLNMSDEAVSKGVVIDTRELYSEILAPVVETAAIHGTGIQELRTAMKRVHDEGARMMSQPYHTYPSIIENALESMLVLFPEDDQPSKGTLLLYLTKEEGISEMLELKYGYEIISSTRDILNKLYMKNSAEQLRQIIFRARESWADRVAEKVTTRAKFTVTGITQKIAWASRHPIIGWPILALVMWATFYGVGTIATGIADALDGWFFAPATDAITAMLAGYPVVSDFIVGEYGILTMGVFNAIGTVVPILIVFFTITSFLEDLGYLPNLSILLNRMFSVFGLTGKSVLPMVLGFGCNTMATLTSRTLETRKERLVASFLIALGIPCAVQLGVLLAIMATAPFSVLVITLLAVGGTQILSGIALNKLVPTEETADFIMELPNFRFPDMKHVMLKTYYRVKWFLVEALPLFVFGAALMFALQITGILGLIKIALNPIVVGFLSLPDKLTEVFIMVLSRRELGAVYFKDMVDAGQVDYYQTIVGLIVITLFIPCISNTMVMFKELGAKWAIGMNVFIMTIAILVGGL